MSIEPWTIFASPTRVSRQPVGSTGVSSGSDRDSLAASPENDHFANQHGANKNVGPIGGGLKPSTSGFTSGSCIMAPPTPYESISAAFSRTETFTSDFEESRLPIFRSLSSSDQ